MSVAPITDSTFEQEVLTSDIPVLVDFWAPWCGPCRMVAPVVDELSQDFDGQVKVVKVNTDENPTIASQYGIRSIPTLIVFKRIFGNTQMWSHQASLRSIKRIIAM